MYNTPRYNREVYNAKPNLLSRVIIALTASFIEGAIRVKFIAGQLIAKFIGPREN